VEDCLRDKVSIIAKVGPGSGRIEDLIDEIVVGNGADPARFVCASSHAHEPFCDIVNMVECWELERRDPHQKVWL
jgi:hypothetical protein